jgi:opine dehydrogenase
MFKKIAILGAGHGGHAMSAELSQVGYEVNLYEHPDVADNLKPIIEKGGINLIVHTPAGEPFEGPAGGKTGFVKITGKVTSDMKEAVEGVDLIMLVVPAHVRESFIRLLAPHVEDGQTIVVWPGYFSAILTAKIFKDMGVEKDVTICETESLIYTCKKIGPAQVFVKGKKNKLLLGVFPSLRTVEMIEHLKKIYPQLVPAQNVLETTFINGNPSIHPQSILLNMYRTERKFYPYFEEIGGLMYSSYDVTPGMAGVMEAVDREKIALGGKFGLKIITIKDNLTAYYGTTGKDLYEVLLNCYAYQIQMPPTSLQHRYVAEDVPFALVPFASLGDQVDVPVPTIKGIVAIACAATKIDYCSKGLTMEKLGLAGETAEEIIEYVNMGK